MHFGRLNKRYRLQKRIYWIKQSIIWLLIWMPWPLSRT
ncbi:hypothetical protein TH47_02955 [Thalassospira sp. MCCC 1A02803]|nr:hypothetical protein TH47_02955 [Thalassospira sp. MCCC 1A02803]